MTGADQQRHLLEEIWQINAEQVREAGAYVDPLLFRPYADERACLTLIGRAPAALVARIAPVKAALAALAPLYCYPPESIHFTIRGIYDYGKYRRNEADIAEMAEILGPLCQEVGPLQVHFQGLNLNRGAIYLQGFYDDTAVTTLRTEIGRRLARFHVAPLPTLDRPVDFLWINLARFAASDAAPVVTAIEQSYRETDFGAYRFSRLELVEMDKYFRPGRWRRFGQFEMQ